MVPAAPFVEPVELHVLPTIALLVLGLGGTGVAYSLLYRIITDDGPVAAAAVTYLLSVVAVVLGALVLDDPVTVPLALGVALVLVGVALTRRPTDQTSPAGRQQPTGAPSGSGPTHA
jgi:drug/metabolite transporter (DMT)-like permease